MARAARGSLPPPGQGPACEGPACYHQARLLREVRGWSSQGVVMGVGPSVPAEAEEEQHCGFTAGYRIINVHEGSPCEKASLLALPHAAPRDSPAPAPAPSRSNAVAERARAETCGSNAARVRARDHASTIFRPAGKRGHLLRLCREGQRSAAGAAVPPRILPAASCLPRAIPLPSSASAGAQHYTFYCLHGAFFLASGRMRRVTLSCSSSRIAWSSP